MADPSLASRAPESDLYEESIHDSSSTNPQSITQTSPQAAPPLGDHCTTDRPLPPSLDAPSGSLTKWHLNTSSISSASAQPAETEVYISKPADYPSTPARLLLLLTNGTGIHSLNNQHQADLFARQGYLTIMPDMFHGDPAPNSKPAEEHSLSSMENAKVSWLDTVKLKVAETAKSFGLDMWLARHTEATVMPGVRAVLEMAKEEYADAVEYGGGVYAVGYCFGGRYVLILAGEADTDDGKGVESGSGKNGVKIKTVVCAHGTLVGREELGKVNVPVKLICIEEDPLFPAEVLDEGRKRIQERGIEHDVEVFKGVPHGFAVVGEYESKTINDAQAKAFDSMVQWLNAH